MEPSASDPVAASDRRRARLFLVVSLLGTAVVFWAQFGWVKSTNFWGHDEWLVLSLTTRGIIDVPHSNRPLVFIWHLPVALLVPHDLGAVQLLHGSYLLLCGCLVFLICRRLAPGLGVFAFLSGVFACIWSPLDLFRLNAVACVSYSGLAFGTSLAVLLYVESWRRGSKGWLLLRSRRRWSPGGRPRRRFPSWPSPLSPCW